jgi:hypothetical protein
MQQQQQQLQMQQQVPQQQPMQQQLTPAQREALLENASAAIQGIFEQHAAGISQADLLAAIQQQVQAPAWLLTSMVEVGLAGGSIVEEGGLLRVVRDD